MEWYQKGFGGHLGNVVLWNGPCLIANPQRISAADFELAVSGQTRCGYNTPEHCSLFRSLCNVETTPTISNMNRRSN